jgi:hypothetical protein
MYIYIQYPLSCWAGYFGSLKEILALIKKGAVYIKSISQ